MPHANEIVKATICDLRERPDAFGGKTVQVAGWIYTDIERFGLEEPNCAVSLEWSENKIKTADAQVDKFTTYLRLQEKTCSKPTGSCSRLCRVSLRQRWYEGMDNW
jgi:hypothetical protein